MSRMPSRCMQPSMNTCVSPFDSPHTQEGPPLYMVSHSDQINQITMGQTVTAPTGVKGSWSACVSERQGRCRGHLQPGGKACSRSAAARSPAPSRLTFSLPVPAMVAKRPASADLAGMAMS